MSLHSLQLDDLTWTTMVDAIRSRIIANSNGDWTMHGPVDPGVTLLELFAYQFEQRLFWLDQVSGPLVRSWLSLLDDAPPTTLAAKTLLAFQSLDDNLPETVPAGTVFYPRDQQLPLPFTTLEPLTVLPVGRLGAHPKLELIVAGKNRTNDLRVGRLPQLLSSDHGFAQFQIVLWLNRKIAAEERGGSFSLLLDLDTVAGITPQWAPPADETHWSARVTSRGYERPTFETDELVSNACQLARVDVAHDRSTSTDPANWINDFVSCSWSEAYAQVEVPAKLSWRYSSSAGTTKAFNGDQLVDGTGGLRRSGLVRIKVPADWEPMETIDDAAAYSILVTCEACTYSAPPQLKRIVPNAIIAQQLEPVALKWKQLKPQLDEWLRLPGQKISLAEDMPEPLEKSVHLQLREADGWHDWRPTDDFYHHGPEDRVFTVDRLRKQLLFGDGLTGRIPTLDDGPGEYGKVCYHAGGGSQGNVGELVWVAKPLPPPLTTTSLQPRNPVPGIGGAEAKTIAEAKARTGRALSRRERAVTADDFEFLAVTTPGVGIARAHAAVGHHPDFPCYLVPGAITVFVVPRVPREADGFETGQAVLAPTTDPGALAEVARRLDARRLVTSEVFVRSAPYRAVRLVVDLQGIAAEDMSLRAEISMLLTKYLDPFVGGDQSEGWPFGGPLRPSSFTRWIQSRLEDGIIVKRVAIALDQDDAFADCEDVEIETYALVYLKDVTVHVDPRPTTSGGLR